MNSINDLKLTLKKKENMPLYTEERQGNEVEVVAYLDEESGKMHVAYGHLLEQEQTPEELDAMGIEDELHDWTGFKIDLYQADKLLDIDIQDAIDSLQPTFTEDFLHTLTQDRFTALVGMSYQLGGYGVQRWKGMCGAILEGDWERAGDEMEWSDATKKKKRSHWWTQTKSRCEAAAHAMRTGYFPGNAPEEVVNLTTSEEVELPTELVGRINEIPMQLFLEEVASRMGYAITISQILPYSKPEIDRDEEETW